MNINDNDHINILFTGAGRRNYIIDDFRDALRPLGGRVVAMNSHAASPAMAIADIGIVSPRASDREFPAFLLEVCDKYKVNALCTLIDSDMQVLSGLRHELARLGTRLILPKGEWIDTCLDKLKMNHCLEVLGLPVVKSFTCVEHALEALADGRISFPLIIKPRFGSGSLATYKLHDEEELLVMARRVIRELKDMPSIFSPADASDEPLIIQPFIHGTEYNLNVVNDLKGRYQATIVKEKISMRSGETDIAVTRSHPELEELGCRLSALIQHPFLLDVDLIMHHNQPFLLDMNPRIGGAYPFGRLAGVRYAEAMVRWLEDDDADLRALLIPQHDLLGMKGISLHLSS